MRSLLVVVIVGGALAAITTSALDAAQPATARAGNRSAGARARELLDRTRSAAGRSLQRLERARSALAAPLLRAHADRRSRDAGSGRTAPTAGPVAVAEPGGAVGAAGAGTPAAGADTDELDDDLFDVPYETYRGDGVVARLRALAGFTGLVVLLGAAAAMLVLTGLFVAATTLQAVAS